MYMFICNILCFLDIGKGPSYFRRSCEVKGCVIVSLVFSFSAGEPFLIRGKEIKPLRRHRTAAPAPERRLLIKKLYYIYYITMIIIMQDNIILFSIIACDKSSYTL